MLKPTSPAEENPFEKIMGFSMRFSWEMLEMMIFQEVDPQNRRDLSGVHGNIIGNHSFLIVIWWFLKSWVISRVS